MSVCGVCVFVCVCQKFERLNFLVKQKRFISKKNVSSCLLSVLSTPIYF